MTSAAVLIEHRRDSMGCYVERWFCEPPDLGVTYVVTEQQWQHGWIRDIHAWEPTMKAKP